MPIYEYRCGACDEAFERLIRAGESPGSCPACGSADVERVVSLPAVRSEQTRRRATQDLRSRNRATRGDQERAEVRRIEEHSKDHGE